MPVVKRAGYLSILCAVIGVAASAATAASPASQAAYDEAQALFNAKSYAQAADKFESAVAADPGFALAWYSLARVRRKMNQCTSAIAAYRRYIALEPDKSEPYYGLGLCLRETGDRPGAIEALKNPCLAVRYLAWTKLHEAGAAAEPALVKLFQSENPRYRARALWRR